MPDRDDPALSQPIVELKAELFKAMAHPTRIRVLEVLAEGEHSVGDMQALVGVESSNLSQQLAVLRRAGLVTTRKEGSTVIYAMASALLIDLLAAAKRVLIASLSQNQDLLDDLRSAVDR